MPGPFARPSALQAPRRGARVARRASAARRAGAAATVALVLAAGVSVPVAAQGIVDARRTTVLHDEWARALARIIDRSPDAEPADPAAAARHHFDALCPGTATTVAPETVRIEAPRMANGDGTLRVDVPAGGIYALEVSGRGTGRWEANRAALGTVDPTALGVDVAEARLALRPGANELRVALAPGAHVERVALRPAPIAGSCIAPAAGWRLGTPLRFGDKARTLALALGLAGRLPHVGEPVRIEGEHFRTVEGSGERTDEPVGAPLSGDAWARVTDRHATFEFDATVPEAGTWSVLARVRGAGRQVFWLDDRWSVGVTPEPDASGLAWVEAFTLALDGGPHTIRARVPAGSGIDVLHLVRRRTDDRAYLDLLESYGVREGPADAVVTVEDARRNLDATSADRFQTGTFANELSLVEAQLEELFDRPLSPILPGVP